MGREEEKWPESVSGTDHYHKLINSGDWYAGPNHNIKFQLNWLTILFILLIMLTALLIEQTNDRKNRRDPIIYTLAEIPLMAYQTMQCYVICYQWFKQRLMTERL